LKVRALASPASLKGVLAAEQAAAALARGVRRVAGWQAEELAVADGGEGTASVLAAHLGGSFYETVIHDPLGRERVGRWLLLDDGTAVVESAEAVGYAMLAAEERNPLAASSRGVGELVLAALSGRPREVIVAIGGTATVDGGLGALSVLDRWPGDVGLRVACDVRNPLLGPLGAARVFGPQKGASAADVEVLETRLAASERLRGVSELPGSGAGGGLGAAFASLGGELCDGAELVLDAIDFDRRARSATFVVTGEGTVDATTLEGKAPGAVVRRCRRLGVPCTLFGGRVADGIPAARSLSGVPARAVDDLERLGEQLARELL